MPKWHPIWGRATGSACARCFWIHRGAGTWDMTRVGSCCGPHQRPLWPGLAVLIWNWSTPYEQELPLQTTSGSASAAQGVPRHTYPTSCSIAGQKFHMLRDRRNGRIFLGLQWSIHHGESQHWAEPNSCCLGSQSLWTSLSITQGIWASWDCHVFRLRCLGLCSNAGSWLTTSAGMTQLSLGPVHVLYGLLWAVAFAT